MMGHQFEKNLLMVLLSMVSLVFHSLSIVSPKWMVGREMTPNPRYTPTDTTIEEFIPRYAVSGLWVVCMEGPTFNTPTFTNCSWVDYFSNEEYSPDPNDSTPAIPYAAKRASPFMMMSMISLVGAFALSLGSCWCIRRPVFVFFAGVLFVISGLIVLAALVTFISTFKSEVSIKLRGQSAAFEQDPVFQYHYGWGVFCAVASLFAAESAGTVAISLYIKSYVRMSLVVTHHIPCTSSDPVAHGHFTSLTKGPSGQKGRRWSRQVIDLDPLPLLSLDKSPRDSTCYLPPPPPPPVVGSHRNFHSGFPSPPLPPFLLQDHHVHHHHHYPINLNSPMSSEMFSSTGSEENIHVFFPSNTKITTV